MDKLSGPGITSTANPRVKDIVALRKARERRSSGRFVVEGSREVGRCIAAGIQTEVVYICPELGGAVSIPDEVERIEVSRTVFERMSHREGPDGVLAVAGGMSTELAALALPQNPLVLLVVGIEKPGNLGTMIRSAAAAGADAVIVASPVVDIVNPNVIRASQGAVFSMPVGVDCDEAVMGFLAGSHINVFAADPAATRPYWDAPLEAAAAIVIGAEHAGIPAGWRAVAQPIAIPMGGRAGVDSLNASAAAAVLLFDAARRRSQQRPH